MIELGDGVVEGIRSSVEGDITITVKLWMTMFDEIEVKQARPRIKTKYLCNNSLRIKILFSARVSSTILII